MPLVLIIAIGAIALTGYAFFLSLTESKNRKQKEEDIAELKKQIISLNMKIQKVEFDRSTSQTEADKLKKDLAATTSELKEAKEIEVDLRGKIAKIKEMYEQQKPAMDIFEAENITLKGKLIEKEKECKLLLEKAKASELNKNPSGESSRQSQELTQLNNKPLADTGKEITSQSKNTPQDTSKDDQKKG
ncbi:MAG: hypothetical protein WCI77_10600 [Candidatus Omnitrophota bacterium]